MAPIRINFSDRFSLNGSCKDLLRFSTGLSKILETTEIEGREVKLEEIGFDQQEFHGQYTVLLIAKYLNDNMKLYKIYTEEEFYAQFSRPDSESRKE